MSGLPFPKPFAIRSKIFLAFIHTLRCLVCNSPKVEAAHTGEHGLGTKASDIRCVPLCNLHHQDLKVGLDRIGREAFERMHNVDIREAVVRNIERFIAEQIQENGEIKL